MSCGVYKLVFGGHTYYVGKSTNIEQRFKKHLVNLAKNLSNNKLIEAYRLHGNPVLEILELCEIESLNEREIYYISLLDAVNTGLNIPPGGEYFTSGTTNPNSKYKPEDLEKAFLHIVNNANVSLSEISKIYAINYSTLFDIANCRSHLWLKEKYPQKYKILENLRGTRIALNGRNCKNAFDRGIRYPAVISPNGTIYTTISNVSSFIKEHGLSKRFYNLLKGRVSDYKGWRVYEGDIS